MDMSKLNKKMQDDLIRAEAELLIKSPIEYRKYRDLAKAADEAADVNIGITLDIV